MNKDNAKHFLPLVQALAEGKTIQVFICGEWHDLDNPNFDDAHYKYRIKPEPIEVELWKRDHQYTDMNMEGFPGWEKVKMIEMP